VHEPRYAHAVSKRNCRPGKQKPATISAAGPFTIRPKLREAPGGLEPPNKGFADLCLTTWLRGRTSYRKTHEPPARGLKLPGSSGKPGSNRRPSRWQRDALPT